MRGRSAAVVVSRSVHRDARVMGPPIDMRRDAPEKRMMTAQDDDPFQRRDTRPFLGKTDRRESHRATVSCHIVVGDGGPDIETKLVLSLSGIFMTKEDVARNIELQKIKVRMSAFDEDGDIVLEGVARGTKGGRGFVLPTDDVDFEVARRIARYLDVHSEDTNS
jgi:hypothetical protein